jgi:hypothetical protein
MSPRELLQGIAARSDTVARIRWAEVLEGRWVIEDVLIAPKKTVYHFLIIIEDNTSRVIPTEFLGLGNEHTQK